MARVRRNWTPKEDELLRCAVRTAEAQQRPLLWRELAKAVPGRSNKDCRRRWWNSLAEGNAKGPWAEEEDERLIVAVQKYGTNWTRVAQEVGSRGSDQCSSHWSHVLDPNINYCDWTDEEVSNIHAPSPLLSSSLPVPRLTSRYYRMQICSMRSSHMAPNGPIYQLATNR